MKNKHLLKVIPWIVFFTWIILSVVSYSATLQAFDTDYEREELTDTNIDRSDLEDSTQDEEYENIKTLPDDLSTFSPEDHPEDL